MSIHIDTTQRGREGPNYRDARNEPALNPLRKEFADLIRQVRKRTGRPLKVASTITVTAENLPGVAEALRFLMENSDVFGLVSFQPIAQVGRTESGLGGSAPVSELWNEIATAVTGGSDREEELLRHHGWFGHSSCNRFVQGLVLHNRRGPAEFFPLIRADQPSDKAFVDSLLERFGGLQFRGDSRLQAFGRLLGVIKSAPVLVLVHGTRFALRHMKRLGRGSRLRLLWRWVTGQARVTYFNVVSHHFMTAEELRSEEGRERLESCVFKVASGGELVSMCEFNTLGGRDRLYAEIRGEPA
ncbi:MAG: hypothetical protein AAF517_01755 [Planctomycetota bacterium]